MLPGAEVPYSPGLLIVVGLAALTFLFFGLWVRDHQKLGKQSLLLQEEAASQRALEDLRAALDEHAIVAVTDATGRITEVNDKFCAISKFSRNELIGQDHRIINSGHHPKAFMRTLWSTIHQGRVWKGEIKNRAKDGTFYWVDTTIVPFLGKEGRPTQFIAIRADISARVAAEETMHQSLKALEDLQFALDEHAIVAITDARGTITYVNDRFCVISKFSRDELLGQDHRIINSGHHSKAFMRTLWSTITQGRVWRGEIKNRAKDDSFYWVDTTIVPLMGNDGKPIQFIAIRADITDRKNSETALRASEERFRALVDGVPDYALVLLNLEGRLASWNAGAQRILGYEEGEVLNRPYTLFHPLDDRQKGVTDPGIKRAFRDGRFGQGGWLIRKDGSRFFGESVIAPLLDEGGIPKGFSMVIRDITRQRELDQMKDEFISVVSHELRTPLTSIHGSLGLLRGGLDGSLNDQAKALVSIAYGNSGRLISLVNDILNMEKLLSGNTTFEISTLSLGGVLEQAVALTQPLATTHGHALEMEPIQPSLLVQGDEGRLLQVMANLLSNAIKFGDKGSKVGIHATRLQGVVEISVTNQGPQIPETFLPRMFDRFTQADTPNQGSRGGTGLGLAITKALVEGMHGKLGCESLPGLPVRFFFTLPLAGTSKDADATLEA